jgi:nitrate reductase NapE component
MVDYHYIKRGNKVYGPYYYRSYRVGNKVKKEYLGKDYAEKTKARKIKTALLLLFVLFIFLAKNLVGVFGIEKEENMADLTESGISVENTTLVQHQAVIGQPVRWTRKILLDKPSNIIVNLPIEASNITVKKAVDEKTEKKEKALASITSITGAFIQIPEPSKKPLSLWRKLAGITGFAVLGQDLIEAEIAQLREQGYEEIEITIEENSSYYEIEYETPAPQAEEQEITGARKIITISSDVHYEEIIAFTQLPEIVPVGREDAISLYWLVNGSKQPTEFSVYDVNSNGYIDRIEWLVPSLSEQTYEASITIINVKSYPTLYGNWTVYFNTTGEADLTITAIDGTTWSLDGACGNETCHLKFLNVACGSTELDYTWVENSADGSNNSVFYANYSCSQEGYEESQVLIAAPHTLRFQFGNDVAYAYNEVTAPVVTLISPSTGTIDDDGNITFQFNATDNVKVDNCTLYTNISGAWQKNQTNTTIVNGSTTEFSITGVADDTTFIWNIECYDNSSNLDWADSNWSITVNTWYSENVTFLFDLAPVVILISPSDNTIGETSSNSFMFNVTEAFGTVNCSLYHNITGWGINETNETAQSGNNSFTLENIADDTAIAWNVRCTDSSGSTVWGNTTSNRTLTINLWYSENVSFSLNTPPTISWVIPADLNTSVIDRTVGFSQNITTTDARLETLNCTIFSDANLTNQVFNYWVNISDNTTYTKTAFVNTTLWDPGTYYEKCEITDRLI